MLSIDAPELDTAFTALGHPKRRGMLHTLSFRPATVSQLAEEYDLSLPAIHRHIRVLEEARLIQRKKVGRVNFIALNRAGLRDAQEWMSQFRTEWGTDVETLENYAAYLTDNNKRSKRAEG
jgi:DNA-binding transcriptional ArsR family regulator